MESKRVFFVAQMMCFFIGTELLHGGFSSGISYMIPGECQLFQVICLVSTLKKKNQHVAYSTRFWSYLQDGTSTCDTCHLPVISVGQKVMKMPQLQGAGFCSSEKETPKSRGFHHNQKKYHGTSDRW